VGKKTQVQITSALWLLLVTFTCSDLIYSDSLIMK